MTNAMVCTFWTVDGEAAGLRQEDTEGTGQLLSEKGGAAVGSGRHPAPYAAALKACWARIPDSLLMSGRTFVGARV